MGAVMSALADRARGDDVRKIHLEMIDAVLAGGGVGPVAAIAAGQLGGTVAIVLPAVDIAVAEPPLPEGRAAQLARYVSDRPAKVPPGLVAEVPVRSGDEILGYAVLLDARRPRDAHDVLELAAVAALTAVTLRDAHVTQRRASAALLDELRSPHPPADVLARARQLGADLGQGASALSARGPTERVLATIAQELPGALAAAREDRVEALLPARDDPDGAAARRLARRLGAGLSPVEPDVARLGAALRIAAVTLELDVDLDAALTGSWRLLLRTPERELQALVDATVGRAGELTETVRAYLEHGANMNATAAAIFAHRHTVSSRLERVRALTGHDPQTPLGQAQLALGLQALAVQRAAARVR